MRVTALYYRDAPILFGSPPLKPPIPYPTTLNVAAAQIWDHLEQAGIPGIAGVWGFFPTAIGGPFLVIAIHQLFPGQAKQAALVADPATAPAASAASSSSWSTTTSTSPTHRPSSGRWPRAPTSARTWTS